MATASKVHLSASQQPQFHVNGLHPESAAKASQLLQTNHEQHHIFFNQSGFHNHIAHHLLTLFALGASPTDLQTAYDTNASYQRPTVALEESIVSDMHDPARFATYLGKEEYYHDFLVYFKQEIERNGWQATLQTHVFAETPAADDMLVRMFAGFLHPIIHLGFGVEFQQPAVIAEALAQAAVHDNWMAPVFLGCEGVVRGRREKNEEGGMKQKKSIIEILEECRNDPKLRHAAQFEDENKIRDGILKRAKGEMIEAATAYWIAEGEGLEEKTAEMIDATGSFFSILYIHIFIHTCPTTIRLLMLTHAVFTTASSQHPPHAIKFDFFLMHCLNSSIFFSAFLSPSSSLTPPQQRRLLEWKVWNDITMYVSRGCPAFLPQEIANYTPAKDSGLESVIERVNRIQDDGHAAKLVRAIANAEAVCREWEGRDGYKGRVKGGMWKRIAHMAVDSVESGEPHLVRSCGFEEAWTDVPLREEGEGARL
ncbi:hypothetical protein DDE82_004712 [Stemphylium lycopersici]|nr:hypothetical protein DDE82_004712 [Stemphylium lycopersici]